MQLPRGSFHSIRRGMVLHLLLDEIEKSGFSGYCTVIHDAVKCTLVLNSGNYILAEYGKTEGDAAWLKIHDLMTKKVDAALTSLSEAQLKLCIEFNSPAELHEPVKWASGRPVKTVLPHVRSEALVRPEPRHAKNVKKSGRTSGISVNAVAKPHEGIKAQRPVENEEIEILERDLGSLDDAKLDEMTRKIRENCMIAVEKLHLDHLIQKTS
jgi:hypothetical protein